MEKNMKKNNLILRIFAFTLSLTLMLSIGVFSLNLKVDKVEASSTPASINNSEYNIGLGNWYTYFMNYDPQNPYEIINAFGEPILHIQKQSYTSVSDLLDYCNVRISLNTRVVLEDGEDYVDNITYNLSASHNSMRYRYYLNNISIPFVGFTISDDNAYNIPHFGLFNISNIEINIPKKYSSVINLYNNALISRYLFYKTNDGQSKLNIVFARDNTVFDSDPVMSVYLTFDSEFADPIISRYLYNYSVLRIDRSEYINYVDRVIEKPVYEFTPLNAIKDGVNSFLSIKVLPNFSIGNFLALALGISFFGFLLHLIIK